VGTGVRRPVLSRVPHLAYLHARIALNSKQAELNNLYADSVLMGIWAAQMHFCAVATVMVLSAVILNNAANGGVGRLAWGGAWFAAAAAAWGRCSAMGSIRIPAPRSPDSASSASSSMYRGSGPYCSSRTGSWFERAITFGFGTQFHFVADNRAKWSDRGHGGPVSSRDFVA